MCWPPCRNSRQVHFPFLSTLVSTESYYESVLDQSLINCYCLACSCSICYLDLSIHALSGARAYLGLSRRPLMHCQGLGLIGITVRSVRVSKHLNALAVNTAVLYAAHGTLSSFQAIKHLHDNQLVHLDIKPENIFVMREGYCKLGDFGLVMDLSGSVSSASAWLCRVIGTAWPNGCDPRPTGCELWSRTYCLDHWMAFFRWRMAKEVVDFPLSALAGVQLVPKRV